MKKLLPDKMISITTLLNNGKPTRDMARIIECSSSTAVYYRPTINNELPKLKWGRPRKLSSRDERAITLLVMDGKAKTAAEAGGILNQGKNDMVSLQNYT